MAGERTQVLCHMTLHYSATPPSTDINCQSDRLSKRRSIGRLTVHPTYGCWFIAKLYQELLFSLRINHSVDELSPFNCLMIVGGGVSWTGHLNKLLLEVVEPPEARQSRDDKNLQNPRRPLTIMIYI